jgi:hypothetical protein
MHYEIELNHGRHRYGTAGELHRVQSDWTPVK